MPSPTRQIKRPFQPSITSFFAREDRNTYLEILSQERPEHGVAALPSQIQSSLLNVGMRIRKSVPEGYKTGSYCGLGLSLDGNDFSPMIKDEDDVPDLDFGPRTTFTELTPFCGILKTGGYSTQPSSTQPSFSEPQPKGIENDPFELYTSSQSSIESNAPLTPRHPNGNKRRFEETPDDAYAPFIFDDGLDLQPVSPRSKPVSHTRMPNLNSIRQFAVPKSRRKGDGEGKGGGIGDEENYHRRGAIVAMDFGDADFLQPTKDWEDQGEIEMGGV
jgi:hypothetical protein